MGEVYSERVLKELAEGARALLPRWGVPEAATLSLLNISENATFRVDMPGRDPMILRVHRPGYHTAAEIASELAWISALRADGVVRTPAIVPAEDGETILAFDHDGETRHVVAFAFAPGLEPKPGDDLVPGFRMLGAISARLHLQARAWARPRGSCANTGLSRPSPGTRRIGGRGRPRLG